MRLGCLLGATATGLLITVGLSLLFAWLAKMPFGWGFGATMLLYLVIVAVLVRRGQVVAEE